MKLYNYFRSSTSFRVRIALNLKSLPFEYIPVHLAKGEHKKTEFTSIADEGLVPMLQTDGESLSQSMAIMEYLDEMYPTPALMPADMLGRAKVRALSQTIACEIHPLNNLRVLKYLVNDLKVSEADKDKWYAQWTRTGLEAFERQLMSIEKTRAINNLSKSIYCYGATPTVADCCLVPQVFNAKRFNVSLDDLPLIVSVHEACMKLDAFIQAQPSNCPDFEP